MAGGVEVRTPQRHPSNGSGVQRGGQVTMTEVLELPTPSYWIGVLYEITREIVGDHYGQDALAADMGTACQSLNLRPNRKEDSKGDVQRLFLDTWAFLPRDPEARWELLTALCAACGAKPPEPVVEMTAEEKLRLVLAELTPKRRRAMEREYGLPEGGLEP